MSDNMFQVIQENAARAAERAEREVEELKAQQAAAHEARKREALLKRRQATVALLVRCFVAAALCVVLTAFEACGLVDTGLTICLLCMVCVWLAFWAGAWAQLRWCKGGLLK